MVKSDSGSGDCGHSDGTDLFGESQKKAADALVWGSLVDAAQT